MEPTAHVALQNALRGFYMNSQRILEKLCEARGVSLTKIRLMVFIENQGWTRSADIIGAFSLAPRTITEAIDTLEKDGLAHRTPDPEDRRVKRVSLTANGKDILAEFALIRDRFAADLFNTLNNEEEKALTTLVQRLNIRLSEIDNKFNNENI